MEVAACPWAPEHRLVRIGLKGREPVRNAGIQVAFNPAQVGEYRLIGYESQPAGAVEGEDQRSPEAKTVSILSATALYEVVPVETTRRLYAALEKGDYATWHRYTTDEIEDSGQHEVLNWFCLLGAMEALGRKPDKAVSRKLGLCVTGGLRALPRLVARLPAVRRSTCPRSTT